MADFGYASHTAGECPLSGYRVGIVGLELIAHGDVANVRSAAIA